MEVEGGGRGGWVSDVPRSSCWTRRSYLGDTGFRFFRSKNKINSLRSAHDQYKQSKDDKVRASDTACYS